MFVRHAAIFSVVSAVSLFASAAHGIDVVCDQPRSDAAGWSVATGGDVDGDGMPDIAIGAPCSLVDSTVGVGRVFVFSGVDGRKLRTLRGQQPNQRFGTAVSMVGDLNGDGRDEIVVGSRGYDALIDGQVRSQAGKVDVFDVDGNLLRAVLGTTGGANCGEAVAGLDDIDGDGMPDLLIGAGEDRVDDEKKGRAYLVSGADGSTLQSSEGALGFDNWGSIVARAGDLDGDFIEDVIVASSQNDRLLDPMDPMSERQEDTGLVKVLSGADFSNELLSIYGGPEEKLGRGIDGSRDLGLFVGAIGADVGGKNKAGTVSRLDWDGTFVRLFVEPDPEVAGAFGTSVALMDDTAGILASAVAASAPTGRVDQKPNAGRVHVFDVDTGALRWSLVGGKKGLRLGQSLASGVDFDGDGIEDLVVGTPGDSPGGRRGAGSAVLYSGATGAKLYRMGGRRGIETRVFVAGWRSGRVAHVRSLSYRGRRREVQRDTYRRLIAGGLSVAVLDEMLQPVPGEMKLVLGTGHAADQDTVLVIGAGRRSRVLSRFDAFGDGYDGGVNVAAGDVAGNAEDEIVAVQADSADGSVAIRLFQRVDELFGEIIWLPLPSLTAFRPGDKIELGQVDIVADGANVAVGNLVGDNYAEIVVAPASGTPVVRVLRPTGTIFAEWLAYFSDEDGVNVALGDLDGDGSREIVTAPGSGMPRIRVFKANGSAFVDPDTSSEVSFFAFDESFTTGLRVAVADVDLDGRGEIIVGTGPGVTAELRAYEMDGSLVPGWEGRRPLGPASDAGVALAATDRFLRH